MALKPASHDAYKLLHQGTLALSQVEARGLRIDVPLLERRIRKTGNKINRLERELQEDPIYKKTWKRKFGSKTKLGSREQLARVVFEELGHKCEAFTDSECPVCKGKKDSCKLCSGSGKRPSADEAAFSKIELPFIANYFAIEKLKKAKGTYLEGIQREIVDGFLHPVFSLHLARTYRSSSERPNFQNLPIRNADIGRLIRELFIPRDGYNFGEVDYSQIEVKIALTYHGDPTMRSYLEDQKDGSKKDMHRDMAIACYLLDGWDKDKNKKARYCSKNMFVFPQFYGDYYVHCAKALWEAIEKFKLTTHDGIPLQKHLRSKGIKERGTCTSTQKAIPGTFEYHIKQVEDHFWNVRFPVYRDWKKKWYEAYLKNGGFTTLTGFRIDGVYGRNDVINYPVQGSAFHCLLWSLIKLNRLFAKKKMKSMIIGQIHDSLIIDIFRSEQEDVLQMCKKVMTKDIRENWKWINVPLEIEAEVAPDGSSWHNKQVVKI